MKPFINLFGQVTKFENLFNAYRDARKGKRYDSEILSFEFNAEENLLKLKRELEGWTYCHGGYREFIVNDSKKRRIKAAPFRDRVVHHALCNIIEPVFEPTFIYDSYACRKEKGTQRALRRLKMFLRSMAAMQGGNKIPEIYCLQCDISKYFDSINHDILFEMIKGRIGDKKILWLVKEILNSNNHETGKGIPIGNLTSQLFANVYLNELDQFIKRSLKRRYYIRYMDDFLNFSTDKQELWQMKDKIADFLRNRLDLNLHPKKANVFPAAQGIEFLGYKVFSDYRILKQNTVKRIIKRVKRYKKEIRNGTMEKEKLALSVQSWRAYAEFAKSWYTINKITKSALPKS
jgi:retron-type reverse transcriptase